MAACSEASTRFHMPASSVRIRVLRTNLYQKWILCVLLQIRIPRI